MSNEILLSTLLSTDQKEFKIHDIIEKEGLIYFKINNHQFQTTGSWIYHKNHPMFDLAPTKIYAKKQNTAEGIEETKEENEKFDKDFYSYMKHRTSLYKIIMLRSFQILKDKGEEEFKKYIEHHFDITENGENCHKLISMLEAEENKI